MAKFNIIIGGGDGEETVTETFGNNGKFQVTRPKNAQVINLGTVNGGHIGDDGIELEEGQEGTVIQNVTVQEGTVVINMDKASGIHIGDTY